MIHEFNQRGATPTRSFVVSIDLTRVEAVMEDEDWTCIVTGSDTYYVTDKYASVLAVWRKAMKPKRRNCK